MLCRQDRDAERVELDPDVLRHPPRRPLLQPGRHRASEVRKILPARFKSPNFIRAEHVAMESVLDLDIRYNNADKNYGPMAYSQELAKEQCSPHLDYQEKGTYLRIVDETKEDILRSIILKLRSILCHFK